MDFKIGDRVRIVALDNTGLEHTDYIGAEGVFVGVVPDSDRVDPLDLDVKLDSGITFSFAARHLEKIDNATNT